MLLRRALAVKLLLSMIQRVTQFYLVIISSTLLFPSLRYFRMETIPFLDLTRQAFFLDSLDVLKIELDMFGVDNILRIIRLLSFMLLKHSN